MTSTINIYCDESCHLERDGHGVMVLGAVRCFKEAAREIADSIRQIKRQHGLADEFEIKWQKVSPAKSAFYIDLVDYFFATTSLRFRALIVPDKSTLCHDKFDQDHDDWYYKMYFTMLKWVLSPKRRYRIFMDIKDTKGAEKIRHLREVLSDDMYDFDRKIIETIQLVRSHDVQQIQLADLLIGAVAYANRGLLTNSGKVAVVERIRELSGYKLTRSTLLTERKVNLFCWHSQDKKDE